MPLKLSAKKIGNLARLASDLPPSATPPPKPSEVKPSRGPEFPARWRCPSCGKRSAVPADAKPAPPADGDAKFPRVPFARYAYDCPVCEKSRVYPLVRLTPRRGSRNPGRVLPPISVEVRPVTSRHARPCNRCGCCPDRRRYVIALGSGRSGRSVVLCERDGDEFLRVVAARLKDAAGAPDSVRDDYRRTVEDVFLVDRRPAPGKKGV